MTQTHSLNLDLGDRAYDIHIGSGLLNDVLTYIPFDVSSRRVFIVCDENTLMPHAQNVANALQGKCAGVEVKTVPAGEKSKSFESYQSVLNWLLENNMDRSSVVFAIGGGVIGDLGGFAAATAMRGIPYIQIPTSLLAMVDSSVGGKTGINTSVGKNLVGAFYQPKAVIADLDALKSLPSREVRCGYAECIKHAAINDADLFAWCEKHLEDIKARKPDIMRELISRNCAIKAKIVEADEKEAGQRALLNLGHTFGHAIEAAGGYDGTILHGEAVAIGTSLAFRLSAKIGLCDQGDVERLENHIAQAGLPTKITLQNANPSDLVQSMYRDKKAKGDKITFVLTRGIGEAFLSNDVDMDMVEHVITEGIA